MNAKLFNKTSRMHIYNWKIKDLKLFRSHSCVMSELVNFAGIKAFRFALKRADAKQTSISVLLLNTSLHKVGIKIAKVSVQIKSKTVNNADTEPVVINLKARHQREDILQLFSKEIAIQLPVDRETSITFEVFFEDIIAHYLHKLTDSLFAEQLWKAAQNKQWTDIEFVISSHLFTAHRAILAARSPVFATQLQEDHVRIKVECTNPVVFESFLYFIYTGVFQPKSSAINDDLLKLAERYQIKTLESLCRFANQDVNAEQLTSFVMAQKPDFEFVHKKPLILTQKTKSILTLRKAYTVIDCSWAVNELPDTNQVISSDPINFGFDGNFRIGLSDHPCNNENPVELHAGHFLYFVATDVDRTGTLLNRVGSYVDGSDYSRMDKRGHKGLLIFGRELYDVASPKNFDFEIMLNESVENYLYQQVDIRRLTDLWSAVKKKTLTDVEFIVCGITRPAHCVIVGARSPVFASLFEDATVESVTRKIKINDIEVEVFDELLFFLYTGTLRSAANNRNLLRAAEKYQVSTLVKICGTATREVEVEEITTALLWL